MQSQNLGNSVSVYEEPAEMNPSQPQKSNSCQDHRLLQTPSQNHPHTIRFYSSQSGFQKKLPIYSSHRRNQASVTESDYKPPPKKYIVYSLENPLVVEEVVKGRQKDRLVGSQQTDVKIEEPERQNSKKMYEFNQINSNLEAEKKKSMLRKITRGVWSISSRKYQPKADIHQIFDAEELADSMIALDECKLWRNLMKKYIPKKVHKTKRRKRCTGKVKLEKEQPQQSVSDANRRGISVQSDDSSSEDLVNPDRKQVKVQQPLQNPEAKVQACEMSIINKLKSDQQKLCMEMEQIQLMYLRGQSKRI